MRILKRNKKSQAGGSLFEVILSFGIFGLTMVGFTSALNLYKNQAEQIKKDQKAVELRRLIGLQLKNEAAWKNTMAANAEMSCITSTTNLCDPATLVDVPFDLYDASNNVVVESSRANSGINIDMKRCQTYPSSECPFKIRLAWSPQCGTRCDASLIKIQVSIESSLPGAPSRFSISQTQGATSQHYMNVDPFARVVRSEFRGTARCILYEPGNLKCFKAHWVQSPPEVYGMETDKPPKVIKNFVAYDSSLLLAMSPIPLGSGQLIKDFALGGSFGPNNSQHACAILGNNGVKCWGSNQVGQLGLGDTVIRGDAPGTMGDLLPFVDLGNDNGLPLEVKQLAAGSGFTCALFFNKKVKCWGRNQGLLGISNVDGTVDLAHRGDEAGEMGDALPFLDFGLENNDPTKPLLVSRIVANGNNACALFENGRVKCWGDNQRGQLGLGNAGFITNHSPPYPTDFNWDHTKTEYTSVDLKDDQGNPVLDENGNPVKVNVHGNPAPAVPTSPQFVFYGNDDSVDYTASSLGLGPIHENLKTLPYIDLGSNPSTGSPRRAIDLALGSQHICAVLETNDVTCWGNNYYVITSLDHEYFYGFLGIPTTRAPGQESRYAIGDQPGEMGNNLTPVNLGLGKKAKKIFSFDRVTCALLTNDQTKCWGSTGFFVSSLLNKNMGFGGNLGNDPQDMGDNLEFINLGTSEPIRHVSVGTVDVCATLSSGRLKCWGWGWIPNGNTNPSIQSQVGDSPDELGNNLYYVRVGSR